MQDQGFHDSMKRILYCLLESLSNAFNNVRIAVEIVDEWQLNGPGGSKKSSTENLTGLGALSNYITCCSLFN